MSAQELTTRSDRRRDRRQLDPGPHTIQAGDEPERLRAARHSRVGAVGMLPDRRVELTAQ